MKKLLATALIATVLSAPFAIAHEGKHAPDFDRLAERLELDASQTEAFKQVMQEQHEKHKAQRQEMMKAMKANREAMAEDTRAQLSNVLTQEQLDELKKMQEERHKKGWGKRHCKEGQKDSTEQEQQG